MIKGKHITEIQTHVFAHKLRRFKSDRAVRAYCNMNQLGDFRVTSIGMVQATDPYDRIITLGWIA